MGDQFSEITTTSWGTQVVRSIKGVIFGLLIFLASFPIIFWNEGRSVDRIKTLDEGRGAVVSTDAQAVDSSKESALIHTSGMMTTNDIVRDPYFGVQENALRVEREVEMYQWKERTSSRTEKQMGGSEVTVTTYSYEPAWSKEHINSALFKHPQGHENPASMPYKSTFITASNVTLGAYRLDSGLIGKISKSEGLPLTPQHYEAMSPNIKGYFKPVGDTYYYGDPNAPKIGSMRVTFRVVRPQEVSVIGKQQGDRILSYKAKNGEILLLSTGIEDAQSMFDSEEASNTMLTWLIRGGALFLMWLGLYMVLRPLAVIGGVVPLLGSVLAAGASAIAGLITLVAGFSSIAIAWFVYRPLIAVGLLVVVVGATVAILTAMRRSKEAPKAMPTASAPVAAESPIAGVYQENPIVSLREERQSERL